MPGEPHVLFDQRLGCRKSVAPRIDARISARSATSASRSSARIRSTAVRKAADEGQETLAMWGRYGKGVVIFSRYGSLKSAMNIQLAPIFMGIVRYGEKDMTGYNTLQFLFTKRRLFEKERELRIVLQCYDPMAGANRHYDADNFPHREPLDENPLHDWVHSCKRRRIDLKALVTEIRLSPWATPGEFEEVGWWVKNKNFSCPITHSECEGPLTPTPEELKKYGL